MRAKFLVVHVGTWVRYFMAIEMVDDVSKRRQEILRECGFSGDHRHVMVIDLQEGRSSTRSHEDVYLSRIHEEIKDKFDSLSDGDVLEVRP